MRDAERAEGATKASVKLSIIGILQVAGQAMVRTMQHCRGNSLLLPSTGTRRVELDLVMSIESRYSYEDLRSNVRRRSGHQHACVDDWPDHRAGLDSVSRVWPVPHIVR